ncbi:MAG: hypothetical protein ACOCXA_01900 [Planctomycetota bacterium]
MLNKAHPTLLEPMFHIDTEQVDETIYLERDYLYESQLPIRPSYGAGEKILCWTHRAIRYRNDDHDNDPQTVLLASDLFLLDEPHEFNRFRMFLKNKRILDAQARSWLADNAEDIPDLASDPTGMERICACLGNIQEWPDPENGFRKHTGPEHSLEGLSKQYSAALVAVRTSSLLPHRLMQLEPEQRLGVFRLLSYAEDPDRGPAGLFTFLRDLGARIGDRALQRQTAGIANGMDLQRALAAVRNHLVRADVSTS